MYGVNMAISDLFIDPAGSFTCEQDVVGHTFHTIPESGYGSAQLIFLCVMCAVALQLIPGMLGSFGGFVAGSQVLLPSRLPLLSAHLAARSAAPAHSTGLLYMATSCSRHRT